MKFNMPMAAFGGLALVAAAIFFGPNSARATSHFHPDVQKVIICETDDLIDYLSGIASPCGNRVELTN